MKHFCILALLFGLIGFGSCNYGETATPIDETAVNADSFASSSDFVPVVNIDTVQAVDTVAMWPITVDEPIAMVYQAQGFTGLESDEPPVPDTPTICSLAVTNSPPQYCFKERWHYVPWAANVSRTDTKTAKLTLC